MKCKFDETSDKLKLRYSMNHEDYSLKASFTECYMSERFIRLNRKYHSDFNNYYS